MPSSWLRFWKELYALQPLTIAKKTISPAATNISENLAAAYKTVPVDETVYRRTFCGKQRHQIAIGI